VRDLKNQCKQTRSKKLNFRIFDSFIAGDPDAKSPDDTYIEAFLAKRDNGESLV